MLRLFISLTLLISLTSASSSKYNQCIDKLNDSDSIVNNKLNILVDNNRRLIYSQTTPKASIIKYDSFLSLYLVKDSKKFSHPFSINFKQKLPLAMIDKKSSQSGKIINHQVGLNLLATFSEKYQHPSIITTSCCSLEGITTPTGIIQKEYIDRFLSKSKVEYADIGIRVSDKKFPIKVVSVDPYMKNNPFEKYDEILKYNGISIKNSSSLMKKILFTKLGTLNSVEIKRKGKVLKFSIKSYKRYGGGFISDTFLEQKGIYFTQQLVIKRLENNFKTYGVKIGDKLLEVNGVKVKNELELRAYISEYKEFSSLLLERDYFQFFVKIN